MKKPAVSFVWEACRITLDERMGMPDAAIMVTWILTASRGDRTATATGVTGLADPDPSAFTPSADLTPDLAIGWALEAMGAETMARLQDDLATGLSSAAVRGPVEIDFAAAGKVDEADA